MAKLTIATRESRLALWQAHHIQARLQGLGHEVTILGMTTVGDQRLDVSLAKIGGKGLFVKELEVALAEGRADLAVHSLKDVPMELPEGFALAAITEREDARDAFVSISYADLHALPLHSIVGTSSLRRQALIHAMRPDLRIEPLRGNLDTRLRKLDEGHYDAIILAAAGLMRLGLADRIRSRFDLPLMPPAPGQAALGIEVLASRADVKSIVSELNHAPTALASTAERAVSRAMGGSCTLPLAAHATWRGDGWLDIDTALFDDSSAQLRRAQCSAKVDAPIHAEELGSRAAAMLQSGGRPG